MVGGSVNCLMLEKALEEKKRRGSLVRRWKKRLEDIAIKDQGGGVEVEKTIEKVRNAQRPVAFLISAFIKKKTHNPMKKTTIHSGNGKGTEV